MQIKAIFQDKRARQVKGIRLEDLKEAASQAQSVRWFNGSDFLEEVSSREFLRRLNAMPEGCEVVVMAKSSRSKRAFPADTGYELRAPEFLILETSFLY